MAMFSNEYQEEIAQIVQQSIDNGYSEKDIAVMLSEILIYFIKE
jgi:hypothetical protein